ncbi:MAG: HAMP domain-containing histidine kinase [Cyclobacteriaceae bacterium]
MKSFKLSAAITFLCGLAVVLLYVNGSSEFGDIQGKVQTNLETTLQNQLDYIKVVESDFSVLSDEEAGNTFPTFVFSQQNLTLWNTSRVNLKFEHLAGMDSLGLLEIDRSKFVYRKSVVLIDDTKYALVSLVPLVIDYNVSNKYLSRTYNQEIFKHSAEIVIDATSDDTRAIVINGEYLFSIESNAIKTYSRQVLDWLNLSVIGLMLFLAISIYQLSKYISDKKGFFIGFLLIVLANITARGVMLMFSFPSQFVSSDLFNSSIYISSFVNSSLGQQLFNVFSLLLVSLYVFEHRILIAKAINTKLGSPMLKALHCLLYFGGFWMVYLYGMVFLDILYNSQINLDLSKSIEFDSVRMGTFTVIILAGVIAFLSTHVIYKIVFFSRSSIVRDVVLTTLPTIILALYLGLFVRSFHIQILVFHSVYFLALYANDLPSRMRMFRFGSLLYILSAIILLSCIGAMSIYKGFERNELIQKQKFSTRLIIDRDIEGEYLLAEITERIRSDMMLNSKLISPRVSVGQVKERINQLFVDGYFSGYNLNITVFDKDGIGVGKNAGLVYFDDIKSRFSPVKYKTDFENIFFEGNFLSTGRKRYVCFAELERYNNRTGYIILELHQKKQVSKSVFPELLLDNNSINNNQFDYAVYDQNGLAHSVSSFNFKADFKEEWLNNSDLFESGIERGGNHHYAVRADTRNIVITSKVYTVWSMLSNFSFLFLLYLAVAVIVISINTAFNRETFRSFNFSTKILIYLGCAFAVPLLLVGTAILNTLNKSYKAEIDKSFQKQTVAMSENFVDLITEFYSNEVNRDEVFNELIKISRSSRADVNLYDRGGKLISTSQPKIIESNLLSPSINPLALHKLKVQNKDKVILEESLGSLQYKSSYIAIRSFDEGELLGIMSSPFFSSKNHLNRQQTEVFNNIINISTLIFIISIGLSYIAVRRLTNPIMLIAAKLKRTELSEDNSPLEWNSNDEIGVLVNEYNSMLEKLEFSKEELARNEKEAAWREMAKQVAHEIKNPLTPMKLTLQHLDRVLDKENDSRKSLTTLLHQVDTLDQIVTSFSHFAKMPDPENKDFDIIQELKKTIDLHPDKNIKFTESVSGSVINGDRKLFGRIFNNLILNSFQAMQRVESPRLKIEASTNRAKILLAFADVGTGISNDIKDKVFVPNFSTKDSGSGIGLAVAKRGIEHAGGHIWFESNDPEGTTFSIELPLV